MANPFIETPLFPFAGEPSQPAKKRRAIPSQHHGEEPQATPFVKWAGGKRSLMEELLPRVPQSIGTYWEPFSGGAALFFALRKQLKSAVLCDLNVDLVIAYKVIQQDLDALLRELKQFATRHSEEFYYSVRDQHEVDDPIRVAARLLYLNRTCYNGLWRVNSKGQFNVPIGRYENPDIVQEENLRECHKALQSVSVEYGDFTKIAPKKGDFVYFDPPYYPADPKAFTAYERSGFAEQDHVRLCEFAATLHKRGVRVMLSNSDSAFIRELYDKKGFHIDTVTAPRLVNCKPGKRNAVNELLIRSY
jgi:DNA adenine methylase